MRLIAITQEEFYPAESKQIVRLLEGRIDRIHLRKPNSTEEDMRRLIESIAQSYHPYLSLHDHHQLAVEYGLGGVHLNRRFSVVPNGFHGILSRSCHSIEELKHTVDFDYQFLSPIFDSISKHGYSSAFSQEQLVLLASQNRINQRVVALGGVTLDRIPFLESVGFGGAAFLGYVWNHPELFYSQK